MSMIALSIIMAVTVEGLVELEKASARPYWTATAKLPPHSWLRWLSAAHCALRQAQMCMPRWA